MAAPPIVNVSGLADQPHAAHDLVDTIDRACTEIGFFVVTEHGIESAVEEVFGAAHALFDLPQASKEALAMVDRNGFVPARHLVLDDSLHSAPMEYYDASTGASARFPSPADLPGFEPTVRAYQGQVLALAARLLEVLATALDLGPGYFADRMRDPQCFLRMMHYQPRPAGPHGAPPVLTDPHTDYGLITLLATDGVGGLEVRSRDGEWSKVIAPPRSLVVNLGDMLARWTNDRYVSTPHRVVAPVEHDRFSVPFFVNPDPATIVSCVPSCVSDVRPCRYPPVSAGEFLAQRIRDGGYMTDPAAVDA
jgi:isopenicillin N synthase-like dioxygenase